MHEDGLVAVEHSRKIQARGGKIVNQIHGNGKFIIDYDFPANEKKKKRKQKKRK